MNTKPIIVGTVLSAIAAAVVYVGPQAVPSATPFAATATAATVEPARSDDHRGGWWRGHHGRGGGGLAAWCGGRAEERVERMLGSVEDRLTFTPAQDEAWQRVAEAAQAGAAGLGEVCDEFSEAGRPQTTPERLARMERLAETGLDALHEVRTAFDAFYQTLDGQQREIIDGLATRGGRGRRG